MRYGGGREKEWLSGVFGISVCVGDVTGNAEFASLVTGRMGSGFRDLDRTLVGGALVAFMAVDVDVGNEVRVA